MLSLGVAVLVLGHQLWLWARGWRFNALSPYFLCDLVIFALFGLGPSAAPLPHRSPTEEWLLSIYIWGGLIAYYIGLHFPFRFPKLRWVNPVRFSGGLRGRGRVLTFAIAGCLVFLAVSIAYQRLLTVGISLTELASIKLVRLHGQLEGAAALPVVLVQLLMVWLSVHLYLLLQRRRLGEAIAVYVLMVFSIVIIAVTRIPIITTLAVPLAYYHYAVRRINWVLVAAIVLGAPISLTLLHGLRGGGLFAWSVSDRMVAEAQVLHSFYHLWEKYIEGALPLEYGANYYYYSLLALIPKALWQAKPLTSFEARWTENLFGSLVDAAGQINVHTFTPLGEGLVQFGWLGGALNLFLYGIIVNASIRFFRSRPHACLVYFYYAVASATFIRTSVQALAFTTALYVVGVWLYERWLMPKQFREVKECASS
ncbi:MAG: hypothetical protein RMK45_07905 [Armatimonadota bacterium]|nr:hypothetical protein [Armatimonadota bacterium]